MLSLYILHKSLSLYFIGRLVKLMLHFYPKFIEIILDSLSDQISHRGFYLSLFSFMLSFVTKVGIKFVFSDDYVHIESFFIIVRNCSFWIVVTFLDDTIIWYIRYWISWLN